jgi:FHS family glucose/mannose:H+ symporter-like MFS transporter
MNKSQQDDKMLYFLLTASLISGCAAQPLGSFMPFLRKAYGFDYALSGILLSSQSIGNLIATFLSGILPIFLGRRRGILATSVWMSVAYLIFTSGVGLHAVLIMACFMTGISRGGNVNFISTIIGTLPDGKSAKGYNLQHGCFALGAFVSPLLLVLFSNLFPAHGWRIMAAFLCIFSVFQFTLFLRMPLPEKEPAKSIKSIDRHFLKDRRFWLAAAMLFFYISTEYAIVGWLVTYFQDAGILSPDFSQIMNSLFWLIIFVGRMTGAILTGKISGQKLLLADGIGTSAFFLLIYFSSNPVVIVIGIIGFALFMATVYPTAFAFGSGSVKGNDLGNSLMILSGSAGGIITPALIGFVAKKSGIRAGMSVVSVLTFLMLAAILASIFSERKKTA